MMTRNPSRDFKVAAPVNLIVKDLGIIHDETPRCGVPILFGALAADRRRSGTVSLARTESRTVLGYMNEMGRFCNYAVTESGGLAQCDAQELNRGLRRELHLSRRPPGCFVPIELAAGTSAQDTTVPRPANS
jgi:hypothetical protein